MGAKHVWRFPRAINLGMVAAVAIGSENTCAVQAAALLETTLPARSRASRRTSAQLPPPLLAATTPARSSPATARCAVEEATNTARCLTSRPTSARWSPSLQILAHLRDPRQQRRAALEEVQLIGTARSQASRQHYSRLRDPSQQQNAALLGVRLETPDPRPPARPRDRFHH